MAQKSCSAGKYFISLIERLFGHLGWAIGLHPRKFIAISCIITVVLSSGLYKLYLDDDIRFGYTPEDAPSRKEYAVYEEFFNISVPFGVVIFVEAKDNGSLLREAYFNETAQLYHFANEGLRISTPEFANFSFMQNCKTTCMINVGYDKFEEAFWKQKVFIANGEAPDSQIELTYPKINVYGTPFDISGHFYKVQLNDSLVYVSGTNMQSVGMITFFYYGDKANESLARLYKEWESQLFAHALSLNSSLIKATVFGDIAANREATRSASSVMPLVAIGWVSMFIFVLVNVYISASHYGQAQLRQLWLVIATVLSPIAAVLATFGLIAWIGEPLSALMCIIPLLVVAIGVDDAFLLLHSWQRLTADGNSADSTAAQNMAKIFREIGPSIGITSITNCLAFAVGAFTPMPQIQRFCKATTIAIAVDFVFEMTLFSPVLAVVGPIASAEPSQFWLNARKKLDELVGGYASFVASWKAQLLAAVTLAICLSVSILGMLSMDVAFAPHKTFASDSPMHEVNRVTEEAYKVRQGTSFFVMSPPKLPNNTELELFKSMVSEIESLPHALGENFTVLWLREYETWVSASSFLDWFGIADDEDLSYDDVPEFMSIAPLFDQVHAVKWHHSDSGVDVESFYFYTAFHSMTTWSDRVDKVSLIRQVLARYSQFNASMWEYDASIYDISLIVKEVTFTAALITMGCMAIVCLIFIPSLCSVLIATVAIGSICVNTMGLLSWWGTDLDPFTMVNIIMSVGFSVDYTSHVVYHFHSSPTNVSQAQRVQKTLEAVALPMVQAAASTLICISLLGFHNTYMIVIFAKMVFLVVCSGLLHGIFILPTLLAVLPASCTGDVVVQEKGDQEETIALS